MWSQLRVSTVSLVILTLGSILASEEDPEETGRIINGEESLEGAWPFLVSLDVVLSGTRKHKCGGTIWNEDTILTAAHCFIDANHNLKYQHQEWIVILAHTDISTLDETYLFKVKQVITHEEYNDYIKRNDIAIVKLTEKIDFTGKHSKVRCICDPEPLSSVNTTGCIAMGWGWTESPDESGLGPPPSTVAKLRQVRLPIHPARHYECYRSSSYTPEYHLCAGGNRLTEDSDAKSRKYLYYGTCRGDSGGPLVCPHKDHPQQYIQVGVTTFGDQYCKMKPSYFAPLSLYHDWIERASGETPSGKFTTTSTTTTTPEAPPDWNVSGPTKACRAKASIEESPEGIWPFVVSIGSTIDSSWKHICSGAIWNEDTILTAAHCLMSGNKNVLKEANQLSVILGHSDISQIDETYLFTVKSHVVHEKYNQYKYKENDLAVLKLEEKIDLEGKHSKARCICNPEPLESLDTSKCISMGWRSLYPPSILEETFISKLQQVEVSIGTSETCTAHPFYHSKNHLCVGGPKKYGSSFNWYEAFESDTGGPLVCPHKERPKQYVLVGVASLGSSFCNDWPTYFTRVSEYAQWIEEASGELSNTVSPTLPTTVEVTTVTITIPSTTKATPTTTIAKPTPPITEPFLTKVTTESTPTLSPDDDEPVVTSPEPTVPPTEPVPWPNYLLLGLFSIISIGLIIGMMEMTFCRGKFCRRKKRSTPKEEIEMLKTLKLSKTSKTSNTSKSSTHSNDATPTETAPLVPISGPGIPLINQSGSLDETSPFSTNSQVESSIETTINKPFRSDKKETE